MDGVAGLTEEITESPAAPALHPAHEPRLQIKGALGPTGRWQAPKRFLYFCKRTSTNQLSMPPAQARLPAFNSIDAARRHDRWRYIVQIRQPSIPAAWCSHRRRRL